jgi:hypothetical protein
VKGFVGIRYVGSWLGWLVSVEVIGSEADIDPGKVSQSSVLRPLRQWVFEYNLRYSIIIVHTVLLLHGWEWRDRNG